MGVLIVFLYLHTRDLVSPLPYVLSFVLVRLIEWPAFYYVVTKVHRAPFFDNRVGALCVIGVTTSVALDFVFWKEIESFKFVC